MKSMHIFLFVFLSIFFDLFSQWAPDLVHSLLPNFLHGASLVAVYAMMLKPSLSIWSITLSQHCGGPSGNHCNSSSLDSL
jgi:hypothetical protein